MLDDFKTELKRLGISRIQAEDPGRGARASIALALAFNDDHAGPLDFKSECAPPALRSPFGPDADADDEYKTEHGQLEFADALNATSPADLCRERTNGSGRKAAAKRGIGKMGTRITQLPGLGRVEVPAEKGGGGGADNV